MTFKCNFKTNRRDTIYTHSYPFILCVIRWFPFKWRHTQSEGKIYKWMKKDHPFFSADKKSVCICSIKSAIYSCGNFRQKMERKRKKEWIFFYEKRFTSTIKYFSRGKVQQLFIGTWEKLSWEKCLKICWKSTKEDGKFRFVCSIWL